MPAQLSHWRDHVAPVRLPNRRVATLRTVRLQLPDGAELGGSVRIGRYSRQAQRSDEIKVFEQKIAGQLGGEQPGAFAGVVGAGTAGTEWCNVTGTAWECELEWMVGEM